MLMSDLKIGEHTYDLYDDDAHKEIHSLDARVTDLEEGGVIPGPPGPAGFSPEAEVHRLTATESVFTVTDKKGTTSVTIKDGAPGKDGERGPRGPQGEPGKDGASGFTNPNLLYFNASGPMQESDVLEIPGDIITREVLNGAHITATYNIDGSITLIADTIPFELPEFGDIPFNIKKNFFYSEYNSPNYVGSVFSEENVPITLVRTTIDNDGQINYNQSTTFDDTEILNISRTINTNIYNELNNKGYFRFGMKLEESISKNKTAWTPYTGSYLIPLPKSSSKYDSAVFLRRLKAATSCKLSLVFQDGLTIPYYDDFRIQPENTPILDRTINSDIKMTLNSPSGAILSITSSKGSYTLTTDTLNFSSWSSGFIFPKGILVEL